MIIKLTPKQITDLWDSIRYGIISSVAPIVDPTPDKIQDILCQLLKADMQCWCVYDEDKKIYGYITTSISVDINTNFRSLVIYSLFLFEKAGEDMWKESVTALEAFAKKNLCTRIAAYTTNKDVVSIADKLGYNKNCTYLTKDI